MPGDIAKVLDMSIAEVNNVLFRDKMSNPGTYDEEHAAWFETNLYMQNQLLRDTDVMSMSHGLEVRVPFLDEDLQRVTASISSGIRFSKEQPKKLLIDSFKSILPEKIWNRPKMGFTFPLQEWMSNHKDISDESFFKGDMAKATVKKFKNGQLHWSKMFALYQIQLND